MLANEIQIGKFVTLDDILVGKATISTNLMKINFPKMLGQAPSIDLQYVGLIFIVLFFIYFFPNFQEPRAKYLIEGYLK